MRTYTADWIVPIAGPPIRHGVVTIEDGRILSVGEGGAGRARSLGHVAVLPALVNAHTHLELSYLHRRVPPSSSFNEWVLTLMALRRGMPGFTPPPIDQAARHAIGLARATGTGLFGDVSNTLVTVPLLREAGMPAHVFHELLGFNVADAAARARQGRSAADAAGSDGDVRISLAPHAPYSVSSALFSAIRQDADAHPPGLTSVHLGESAAEVELLRQGTGAARAMLETLGVWTDDWTIPGVSPVEYLDGLGFIDARTLVVHGVQFEDEDLRRLRSSGATLVSCPRSNRYVGAGEPPLESFYAAGLPVAFGTDSLASVADLNMFAELAEARRIAPQVAARQLLHSATLEGARALGFETQFGSIEAGKRAALITVRAPADVGDVEEYLVGGVDAGAIAWLGSTSKVPTPNYQ